MAHSTFDRVLALLTLQAGLRNLKSSDIPLAVKNSVHSKA